MLKVKSRINLIHLYYFVYLRFACTFSDFYLACLFYRVNTSLWNDWPS